jgi:hypothetical protein
MISELFTSSSLRMCLQNQGSVEGHQWHHLSLPVESGLVRTVIKDLQKLTPPEMEHELRIDAEIVRQSEARRVFFPVVGKFLAKPDQHPIEPSQHVRGVINFSLENSDPGHEDGRCLLIKGSSNAGRTRLGKIARDGGHAQPMLSRRMLVVRHKLNESSRTRLERLACGCDDLKVNRCGGTRGNGINFPS